MVCRMIRITQDMFQRTTIAFDQIYVLVLRDFKLKYNSTALGFLWSLLVPILQSAVYYVVFSSIARFGIRNYLLYMLSGMFLWYFFSGTVSMSLQSFLANTTLIKKTSFPRGLLVISRLTTELLHFLLIIPVLIVVMLLYRITPSWSFLTLPLVLAEFLVFTTGVCFLIATLNIFCRDLERVVGVLLQAWFFMSPVFYQLDNVQDRLRGILLFNPITCYLEAWRNIFYSPVVDFRPLLSGLLPARLMWIIGYGVFRLNRKRMAEAM